MNNDDALRKIRACLARAKSSSASENEASTALRQARNLMDQYGLSDNDILSSEIDTSEASINITGHPPAWTTMLGSLICKYFKVEALWYIGWNAGRADWNRKTAVEFVGRQPTTEIAAYAFDVLYRQLKKDRGDFLKNVSKRVKRSNRSARADAYAEGWVNSVAQKVKEFLGEIEPETQKAIEAYMGKEKNLSEFKPRSSEDKKGLRRVDLDSARFQGHIDGKNANLNHGVGQPDKGTSLEDLS